MDGPEDTSKAHINLLKTYIHSLKENLEQEHPANLILEGAGRRDRRMNTTVIIKGEKRVRIHKSCEVGVGLENKKGDAEN